MEVNNAIYDEIAQQWWDDSCGSAATIRYFVQPVRFSYFLSVLGRNSSPEYFSDFPDVSDTGKKLLDIGCGGGFLSEEFAKAGIDVTGIDPSEKLIETAKKHAADSGLSISYFTGCGEKLPFEESTFDYVDCCDVLEHVDSPAQVVMEIGRVLKPGGIFFYDTINRTFAGKMLINVTQKWRSTSFTEPNAHVWEKFIRPEELFGLMRLSGMENKDIQGIVTDKNMIKNLMNFRRCKKGLIDYRELGKRLNFHLSSSVSASYLGYAVKRG